MQNKINANMQTDVELKHDIAQLKARKAALNTTLDNLLKELEDLRNSQIAVRNALTDKLTQLVLNRIGTDNIADAFDTVFKRISTENMQFEGNQAYLKLANVYSTLVTVVSEEYDTIHNDTLIAAYVIEHPEPKNVILSLCSKTYTELRTALLKEAGLEDRWILPTIAN